jgi:hypothetical protein
VKVGILLFKINIYLFTLHLFYSPNTYNQTLTAEQIYKKVNNAVVVILAYDYNNKLSEQGSGVVINDKGYVVTNYHVFSGNNRLEILHGTEIVPYVDIIGIDVEKDILILEIEAKKFPPIKIGNVKSLKIGQKVYAIGSPMGFENTISEGIISGLRNYNESKRDFIQITTSISSGSSGGAVVNNKGELIGISTFTIKEGQNLNFAIPINDVLEVKIDSYGKDDKRIDYELFKKGVYASKLVELQEILARIDSLIMIEVNKNLSLVDFYIKKKNSEKANSLNNYLGVVVDLLQDFTLTISLKLKLYCLGEKDGHSEYIRAMENAGLEYPTKPMMVKMIDDLLPAYTKVITLGKEKNNEDLTRLILLLEKMKYYLKETKKELILKK